MIFDDFIQILNFSTLILNIKSVKCFSRQTHPSKFSLTQKKEKII